ncbi:MAG: alpha/beta hydrolase, partial [Gammaproteobacteria bacterium]|nr:alpha/beta hydrolase [Gammaproteobacteria bacterium]MBT6572779.1 alpha/beta hydrolase [Gammaproteobacteria bacterium]MBT6949289.1 alpha/beta hydrolase [Gammaproteobacteria bacterium]MBT7799426.1 alpha/beta hydrolase [Gammaproteobacteria bacterium]
MQTLKLDNTALSAIYSPAGNASALLVLAHGAGANFEHDHMSALSSALNNVGISTLRFNFPFMEEGKRRVDKPDVCIATIAQAVATANRLCPKAKLFIGGHSFGG